MPRILLRFAAVVVSLCCSPAALFANDSIDFNRDIRPILSDKCFVCHGPAEEDRKADLRLDQRASAVDTMQVIAPGKPDESTLLDRVMSKDPDLQMPPPSSDKEITAKEADLLRRWIEQGADYSAHWAFVSPARPNLPAAQDAGWVRNPIDAFVLAKLNDQQLKQSPAADRRTLIRRLSLDLLGLPPSPEEVEKFVNDSRTDAYDQLVERLLKSPHFGERWARWWLDAARYADSDGYEKDKQRDVWFYRDWVISAMNEDTPYDQFIIRQIAGDLLPNATQADHVATGFLRNSMVNEEGGADPEQFRVEGMFDRIDAIGKAILGITTQCGQCHSHKYDPLTQREYYQMFAALNDFNEATLTVYTPEARQQRQNVLNAIAAIEEEIKQKTPDWRERMSAWEKSIQDSQPEWTVITPTDIPFDGQKFRPLGDGSFVGESYAPTYTSPTFGAVAKLKGVTGIRLELLTHGQLPHNGPGRSIHGTGALTEFSVSVAPADQPDQKQTLKWVSATADVNPEKADLTAPYLQKDASKDDRITGPIEFAIDSDNKTAWTTDNGPGRRNVNRNAVFVPEHPIDIDGDAVISFTLGMNHGGWNSDDNQNNLLGRYRFSVTTSPNPTADPLFSIRAIDAFAAREGEIPAEPLEPRESLGSGGSAGASPSQSSEQQAAIFSAWRATVPEFAEYNATIEELWKQHPGGDSQLVASAMDKPRKSYVLTRGDFLKPAEAVGPGVPVFLGEMQNSPAPDRLDFARWLADRDRPTTARAIVNRIWQSYFGQGLVTTPEDLGSQSEPPSHPELLDWLAVELMDNGWSLKHIHRLIVNSAVYRQSSNVNEHLLSADPFNRWLARGARFRVNAEIVRDIALSASGLLNDRIGGPSIYPDAPEFLFQPPASYGPKNWWTSTGDDAYRRSLYVHSYRSVPYPPLQVFDAPKGDAACVRRTRSNTPLQALVVLNEPQFVECAKAMASRVLKEVRGTEEDRLQYAHKLCTSRPATDKELTILKKLLSSQRQRLDSGELNASDLIGAESASANDLAAWMIVCRAILNLDETITRQ
ncbi:MAG: PSD1 and planctomycete cytochrome C domain-containing protein [Planctomycetaceae bacterium]